MPYRSTARSALLITTLLLLTACADLGDGDGESSHEQAAYDDDEQGLSNLARVEPRGKTIRITAITRKRSELPPEIREAYFAEPTDQRGTTSGGHDFQFYRGSLGAGAIYNFLGTRAIYGPFLTAWAQHGYENGLLGFPESDVYAAQGGMRQKFRTDSVGAGVANHGHTETRNFLQLPRGGTQAWWVSENWYLESQSGTLTQTPQDCIVFSGRYPNELFTKLYGPEVYQLWCGPLPPQWEGGAAEPPPEGADVPNI